MIAECTRSLAHHSNVNASAASSITTTWANGHWLNIFTGGVIAMLVILSIILTASVMFPNATNETVILAILGGGCLLAVLIALTTLLFKGRSGKTVTPVKKVDPALCNDWRMPPLDNCSRRGCRLQRGPGCSSCGPIWCSPAVCAGCEFRFPPLVRAESCEGAAG